MAMDTIVPAGESPELVPVTGPTQDGNVVVAWEDNIKGPMELEDEVLADEGLELETSIWDCALLIGLRRGDENILGAVKSAEVVVIALMNIAMQSCVILAINSSMTKSDFEDDTLPAVTSRRFDNHKLDHINWGTLESAPTRLCEGLKWNTMAFTYSDIDNYLRADGSTFGVTGVAICAMAMFIWVMSMTVELRRTVEIFMSLVELPPCKDANRNHVVAQGDEDVWLISNMNACHKATLSICFLLVRFGMAVLLLVFGLQFLAITPSVSDLILNACALEIVKSVDEMLVESVFSYELRLLVSNTRIAVKWAPSWRQTLYSVVRVLFMVTFFLIGYYASLKPFHNMLKDFDRAICGEDQHFVWAPHPVTNVVHVAASFKSERFSGGVSEEVSCAASSWFEVIKIRAGFFEMLKIPRNATVEAMITGTSPICKANPIACPVRDIYGLYQIQNSLAKTYYEGTDCHDQEAHLSVVRAMCLLDENVGTVPWMVNRGPSCRDFLNLCTCVRPPNAQPANYAACTNNAALTQAHNIPTPWIEMLRGLCPGTCGMCTYKVQTLQGGRRLSSSDKHGFAKNGIDEGASSQEVELNDRIRALEHKNELLESQLSGLKETKEKNVALEARVATLERLVAHVLENVSLKV